MKNKMKIYLLTQNDNNDYDTYDSCVVCAENEIEAKKIRPDGEPYKEPNCKWSDWALKETSISCIEIGTANKKQKKGVVSASFNAG